VSHMDSPLLDPSSSDFMMRSKDSSGEGSSTCNMTRCLKVPSYSKDEITLGQRQRLRRLSRHELAIRMHSLFATTSALTISTPDPQKKGKSVIGVLTYLSGSTFIFGLASFHFISFFPTFLQPFTASIRLFRPIFFTFPFSIEDLLT